MNNFHMKISNNSFSILLFPKLYWYLGLTPTIQSTHVCLLIVHKCQLYICNIRNYMASMPQETSHAVIQGLQSCRAHSLQFSKVIHMYNNPLNCKDAVVLKWLFFTDQKSIYKHSCAIRINHQNKNNHMRHFFQHMYACSPIIKFVIYSSYVFIHYMATIYLQWVFCFAYQKVIKPQPDQPVWLLYLLQQHLKSTENCVVLADITMHRSHLHMSRQPIN